MRLARYLYDERIDWGVVADDHVVQIARDGARPFADRAWPQLVAEGRRAAANGDTGIALDAVHLMAPVARPGKYLAVGLNYADHIAESGLDSPDFPTLLAKLSSCVTGPFDDVQRPRVSAELDYEGELAFVIGTSCRHVAREDAPDVIAGYLVANDITVRDWQLKTPQWVVSKSFDTHGPLGPWIVTADELGDPHDLAIRTSVNGELRQSSNTRELVHDCFALVEILSQAMTLEPGDVVTTGTPSGVGALMAPPRYLSAGDHVRVEIDGIGAIENVVVDEDAWTQPLEEERCARSPSQS